MVEAHAKQPDGAGLRPEKTINQWPKH